MDIFNKPQKDQAHVEEETIFTKKDAVKAFAADHAGLRTSGSTPNWDQLLLMAENQLAKHKVREARKAFEAEQRNQAHAAQMAADQARIDALKNVAVRNKTFYDALQRTDGRVYYSPQVQAQMKADKKAQGLGWYSK